MTAFTDAIEAAQTYFNDPGIDARRVRRRSKIRAVVRPRWFVMAYMRAADSNIYSYPKIARVLGLSHHTSVIHGIDKAHDIWGKLLFRKLTMNRPQKQHKPLDIPQAIHIAPDYGQMIYRGEILLAQACKHWTGVRRGGVAA